jgi:phosphate transport system permease protein
MTMRHAASASWAITPKRRMTATAAGGAVSVAFCVAVVPLGSLLWTVVSHGLARLDVAFVTQTMRGVVGSGGGAWHALAGTALITATATLIAVPLGVLTAIYITEYGRGRAPGMLLWLVDVMAGIPSIVAGLFAYAVLVAVAGPGARSGLAGALALALLMAPLVIRSSTEMLRLVPTQIRETAIGLGSSRHRMVWRVLLPTAASGIISGALLGVARIIGETAPLLLVVGFTDSINTDLASGRMATLPVFIYSQLQNKGADASAYTDRAWAGALLLIIVVFVLTVSAKAVAARLAPSASQRTHTRKGAIQ